MQLQLLELPFLLLSFYEKVQSRHRNTKWNSAFEFQRPDGTFDSVGHGKVLRLQKVQSEGIRLDAARSANDANSGDSNLVCRTSRPSVAIEMTYISAHSWRVRTTPECPAKLRHQPADYSHQDHS